MALISPRNPVAEWLAPRAPLLRRLLWRLLPYRRLPSPQSVVWVAAFDPDDGRVRAQFRTVRPDFGMVTGLVEVGDRLWLGRIGGPGLAWFQL